MSGRARLTPDKEALLELATGRRYSFAELNKRANRAANWLWEQGVRPSDRVSILAHNSVVYLDLLYGCGKIGAVFAPLNWRLVAAELAYIVQDCAPRLLLFGPAFAETAVVLQSDLPEGKLVSLAEFESEAGTRPAAEPPRPPGLNGESPYCILYTSGTTGKPKGAVIPHRQVLWNCVNTAVSWELTSSDVTPVFTPMFHTGGLFAFLAPIHYAGGRVALARQFDADASLQVIQEEGCTVILGVPTLFQMWQKSPLFPDADFSRVRFFISGGAPCPVSLIRQWREATGVVFRQGYGLTEVGPNCFSMTDEESVAKAGTVGKPALHSRMRLVDENGRDVPTGQTGELLIKGPHVCAGYWHNPEATAVSLVDGWFHTGDMARQDADGFFTIVGRFKDMLISGGENVYAAEVEAVFAAHEAVAECALIPQPDEKWGEVGLM
ncbi:MAG: AMP-binding protein, partial [Anaerolineae bacterium]